MQSGLISPDRLLDCNCVGPAGLFMQESPSNRNIAMNNNYSLHLIIAIIAQVYSLIRRPLPGIHFYFYLAT
jgi:hypothetical protein